MPEYLKHKKQNHPNLVPICKNTIGGECKFGDRNCWFIHDHVYNENENIANNAVIQKIFEVMEKATERITNLEMKISEIN